MTQASPEEVWATVLGELQLNVSPANYNTWLKDTRGLAIQGNALVVGAPSAFATEWLRKRLSPLIHKTVARVLGWDASIRFSVLDVDGALTTASAMAANAQTADLDEDHSYTAAPERTNSMQLNPKNVFSTFIVGGSNQLAYAAAVAAAESPGRSYNPLFLYGGVGLGKTHLLQAIAHSCAAQGRHFLYTTSEQFTNEFINALRERKTEEFRAKYRKVDVLLIDDIHFIADKEQTQETFFHTFNDLHTANRQIVLTSDRPPRSMPLLEDRLRSRFEWGLIADIQPPDVEIRLAILRSKAEENGLLFPDEALEFIAHRFQHNIRELEGALNRVAAYCALQHLTPTKEMAEQALEELLHKNDSGAPSAVAILETVAAYYKLAQEDLLGASRARKIAYPRQIAMYLLREHSRLSFMQIGRVLGNRDHSTILHGHQKIALLAEEQTSVKRTIADIISQLNSH